MTGRALVLDGSQKSALAVVRSLGRAGIACDVGEFTLPNICSRSRYCRRSFQYPSAGEDIAAFKRFMRAWLDRNDYDIVLPMTDATLPALIELAAECGRPLMDGYVPAEAYHLASDKGRLLELARSLSVPTPETVVVESPEGLARAARRMKYPVIVKPARSKTVAGNRVLSHSVSIAATPQELRRKAGHFVDRNERCLLQRIVVGEGVGLFAFYRHGVAGRCFAHRRILEKPPSGGISVLCESTEPDEAVRRYGLKLLDALKWHGVAMVEFKREAGTGIPYLMEVNARFWGSLMLAVHSGVDFPLLAYRAACGREAPLEPGRYRVGVRCGSILGIVDHFYLLLRRRRIREAMRSAAVLLSAGSGFADFVADPKDPRPFLQEVRDYLSHAL